MNFLILGDGPEELAWAATIAEDADHRLLAAYPGLAPFAALPPCNDLDDALAVAGVEAVVVGGAMEMRAEALRRVASGCRGRAPPSSSCAERHGRRQRCVSSSTHRRTAVVALRRNASSSSAAIGWATTAKR